MTSSIRAALGSWSVTALMPLVSLAALVGTASAEDDYNFGRAGFGAWLVPVPLDQQASSDLEPGQGMLVIGVRPGSTASTLGVQPGDVVLSLNGQDVSNRQAIRSVIQGVQPGDAANAVVENADGSISSLDGAFVARQPRPGGPWAGPQGGGAPDPMALMAALAMAGPPPGGWRPQDPQALVAQQRQDLLAEQTALTAASDLVHTLLAELSARWPDGAWHLDFTLQGPEDRVVADAALTPPASSDDAVAPAGPSPWSMHLAIDHQAP